MLYSINVLENCSSAEELLDNRQIVSMIINIQQQIKSPQV